MTKKLRGIIIFPTVGIILVLVVFISVYMTIFISNFSYDISQNNARVASRGIRAYVEEFEQRSAVVAHFLANDPQLIRIIRDGGDHRELLEHLNASKELFGIDFLVLVDRDERVLVRTHAPERYGDITPPNPAFFAARDYGLSLSTYHSSPTTPLSHSTTAPIYHNGEFLGIIISNLFISEPAFMHRMSEIFDAELTFYFGNRAVASTLIDLDVDEDVFANDEITAAVLENRRGFDSRVTVDGVIYSTYHFPLVSSEGVVMGMVSAAFSSAYAYALADVLLRGVLIIGLVAAVIAILIYYLIVSKISKPIIEASKRAQLLYNANPVPASIWDHRNNRLYDCNEALLKLFGFSSKQETAARFFECLPPHQPCGTPTVDKFVQVQKEAFEKGSVVLKWIYVIPETGELMPCEITVVRIETDEGPLAAAYLHDLREIEAAKEKESRAHELNQILLDSSPFIINLWSDELKLLSTSHQSIELFGVATEQEYIEKFYQLSPEFQPCGTPSSEKALYYLESVYREGRARFEWIHQSLDGRIIPTEIVMSRFRLRERDMLVGFTLDLSAVSAANEKFKTLFDHAPIAISIWDENGKLIDCNEYVKTLLGLKNKGEFIERYDELSPEFQPCGTPTLEKVKAVMELGMRDGFAHLDWIHLDANGGEVPVTTTLVRHLDHGKPIFVGYNQDLRQIKLAMEKEKEAELAARESKAKTRFLAQISHEIRTPMNAVLGITEIQLQSENLSGELKESLSRIRSSSYLLLAIINNLLDLSKAEAGKIEIFNKPYETISLIVDTVQLNMIHIGSKQIELIIRADPNLPFTLVGDELRVKQVLNNMLSNALKYTGEGTVTLSIDALRDESAASDDVTLVIRVKDTGRGMTEAQMLRLFSEEYLRFNEDDSIEGSGLGMAITHRLLEMMNGKIEVESELGKGTLVTLHIPQKYSGGSIIGDEYAERLRKFEFAQMAKYQVADFIREPMPYGRVLVVDDVEVNLYVVKGHLAPYKLHVTTALSGFEAITKINSGQEYDVIFMDHMMPQMDGVETVRILREGNYKGAIVALTANALVGNDEMFIRNGFDGFMAKPIDIRELNLALNKFVSARHPEEAKKYKGKVIDIHDVSTEATPEMLRMFLRDAGNAIVAFRENSASDDSKIFTTTVHAMKSALANIGENELSEDAGKLEAAGQTGDMVYIDANINRFARELETLSHRIRDSLQNAEEPSTTEDTGYLVRELQNIKAACENYDIKTAVAELDKLLGRPWKRETADILQKARDALFLDSDFDVALEMLEVFL